MNVNGINGNSTGVQAFQMKMNQGTDAVSKNLQNQIANAQKQMQELGENKEMSLEEKMKKRQEIQQQISDLQNQLRQHQIEQRMENQQKSGSSIDQILGNSKQVSRNNGGTGMSSASMQAIISADSTIRQVKVQGAVRSEIKGKASTLESEIKLDSARGVDVSKKQEQLTDLEAKSDAITSSQMKALSDIDKQFMEATEADKETEKKVTKKEKADETLSEKKQMELLDTNGIIDLENAEESINAPQSANAVPKGLAARIGTQTSTGKNVDVKL